MEVDILIDAIKKFNLIEEDFRKFILTAKVSSKGIMSKIFSALEKLRSIADSDMRTLNETLHGYMKYYEDNRNELDSVILDILQSLTKDLSYISTLLSGNKTDSPISNSTAFILTRIAVDIDMYTRVMSLQNIEVCPQEITTDNEQEKYIPCYPYPRESKAENHCTAILNKTKDFDDLVEEINKIVTSTNEIGDELPGLVNSSTNHLVKITGRPI